MNYQQKEAVNDLKNYLNTHYKQRQNQYKDIKAQEADLLWDASRFWAQIIYAADATIMFKTIKQFKEFTHEYKKQTGNDIDTSELFAKHWLRNILGFVKVAQAISSVVHSFGEVRDLKNELEFMCSFYRERSDRQQIKVEVVEVEATIAAYEATHDFELKKDGIYFNRWARVKDGEVEISAMDIYFDPLLKHWNELEFLFQWGKTYNNVAEKGLPISKEAFEKIHSSFGHFEALPALEIFTAQNILCIEGNTYYIDFHNSEPAYWSVLEDKISGFLWEILTLDGKYLHDKDRIITWTTKILYGDGWPNHLAYVTEAAKIRFLDTAMELLTEQKDVTGCENELFKLQMDSQGHIGAEVLYKGHVNRFADYKLDDDNLFELYQSLHKLEMNAYIDYLHDQPARQLLEFLIDTIILNDNEYTINAGEENHSEHYFERVFTLLRQGKEKPYFLWTVAQSVIRKRPEILPYVFAESDICTLGLCLIDELEFSSDEATKRRESWVKSVSLLLQNLPPAEENKELYAKVIFQLFRQLNENKYTISYNRSNRQKEIQDRLEQAKREREVLDLVENEPIRKGKIYGGPVHLLLPDIIIHLTDKFLAYEQQPIYRNGTIQFPMIQWDGLFWLMKTATYWKYKEHFSKHPEKIGYLADNFLIQYLKNIEQDEVEMYDYFEEKEMKKVPLWSEKIERLELLEWIYPICAINRQSELGSFLSPRLKFERTTDLYNKKNSFTADKLRTHIGVLLQILRKLVLPSLPYGLEKDILLQIKERIEVQVVDYLKQYSEEVPTEGRVDLFSYSKEWQFSQTDKEALLPQIAQAINWFSNKENIINALLPTGDMIKLLTLLDYVTAEGIKKTLLDKLKAADLINFLDNKSWIPEIQTTLVKISHYPELLPQMEQTVSFWKERVVESRKELKYQKQLFVTELLIAYFKKDKAELDAVVKPEFSNGPISEIDYEGHKQFYRGLLFIKDEPEKAIHLFNDLAQRYPIYPSIALNRMVAKLNLSAKKGEVAICREAYEEWKEHVQKYFGSIDLSSMEPDISSNLMTLLFALGEHEKIDDIFKTLNLPNRMTRQILEAMVNSLVVRKKTDEALFLVDSAQTYHQFSGYTEIQFLEDLESVANGVDDIDVLRTHHQRIFRSSPARLIRILPDSFNGKQHIHEFIVKEIVHAADKLLEKIKSIEEIGLEDKYNDLIELVLDARLNSLGWQVGAQSRGGHSAPTDKSDGVQPGERDLPILDINKKVLLICEALIYRGASNTASHLQKVFNYHHQRQAFAILFYDDATMKKGFDGNWGDYKENIFPKIVFPAGMEITEQIIDVTTDYDYQGSAIKVGRSVHGLSTSIFHIFVNINYKLS